MFGLMLGLCVLGMVGVVLGQVQDRIGPAGKHRVRLDAVLEITNTIGDAFQWVFRIVAGEPHAGGVFTVVTGREMRGGTALGDLLDALYARVLKAGDLVDPIGDFADVEFELLARPGKNSGGIVHKICPIKKEG